MRSKKQTPLFIYIAFLILLESRFCLARTYAKVHLPFFKKKMLSEQEVNFKYKGVLERYNK